eukprot:CAMPEP_0176005242 /NCGR_PEP_ID=MMETSP0120_2-20121206/2105_1 /TAXON_ID=160619 /ORGANISM="Kryptoperidinium foliaceum, Strain CCMP 1326" /LENGTH=350 /DNA_ID=CAMNT_0017337943 /DNA_START=277 /DNA_END=1329 /DNA_ORIENTATION=+
MKMECMLEQHPDEVLLNAPRLSFSFKGADERTPTLGRQIVEKAFNQSYKDLVATCDGLVDGFGPFDSFQICINKLYLEQTQPDSEYARKWPWWFQTMVRDAHIPGTNMFGRHHFLEFPQLTQMCVYEKGGIKQWRQLQCLDLEGRMNTTWENGNCFKTKSPNWLQMGKSVFLRDPLERFLSAFLDKCVKKVHREGENHCEPTSVFLDQTTGIVGDFLNQTKKLFEMHVDASPLKWNMHFFPLSLHCGGIYQYIDSYDFVGHMDENFYRELNRFSQRFPELNKPIQEVFKLDEMEDTVNKGTETQAALQIAKYYTPKTVRRVLEYTSIDYMLLNLTIPHWAEEMLQMDESP